VKNALNNWAEQNKDFLRAFAYNKDMRHEGFFRSNIIAGGKDEKMQRLWEEGYERQ